MGSKRVPAGAEIADRACKHNLPLLAASAAAAMCMAAGAARAAEPLYETVVVAEAGAENRGAPG